MNKERDYYQLEKNILQLKEKIDELEASEPSDLKERIAKLRQKIGKEWELIKPQLTPMHIVQNGRTQTDLPFLSGTKIFSLRWVNLLNRQRNLV